MSQWYRAFVTIPHTSGLPADACVNTWAYSIPGTGDRDLLAIDFRTRLTAFYGAWNVNFGSAQYAWQNARVKVIDMLDENPRFPFYDASLNLSASSGTAYDLPSEVAIVLSFEGERTSGTNMRRRRGRVYCGPLQNGAGDNQTVPAGLLSAIVTAAGSNLLNPTAPNDLTDWCVYSSYTHHGIPVGTRITKDDPEIPDNLPASFVPVTRCWVDNAYDTQRRRGVGATTRTIVTSS